MTDKNVAVACVNYFTQFEEKKTRKQRRWWSTQLYLKRSRLSNVSNNFLLNDLLANKESGLDPILLLQNIFI